MPPHSVLFRSARILLHLSHSARPHGAIIFPSSSGFAATDSLGRFQAKSHTEHNPAAYLFADLCRSQTEIQEGANDNAAKERMQVCLSAFDLCATPAPAIT